MGSTVDHGHCVVEVDPKQPRAARGAAAQAVEGQLGWESEQQFEMMIMVMGITILIHEHYLTQQMSSLL